MKKYHGKTASKGTAIGTVYVVTSDIKEVAFRKTEDPDSEVSRLDSAIEEAKGRATGLCEKALAEVGEAGALIFEAHRLMLEDEVYISAIRDIIIDEEVCAEYAVQKACGDMAASFAAMDDEYMRARSADVRAVSAMVMETLTAAEDEKGAIPSEKGVIIVSRDLAPGYLASLPKGSIAAIVTSGGSADSHTSILARMMNIPALVSVDFTPGKIECGTIAVVDGLKGDFITAPDSETVELARESIALERRRAEHYSSLKGRATVTSEGRHISLYANIGGVSDLDCAVENDAEGIGLFRSEFLFFGRNDPPGEEEQFEVYRQVVSAMGDKKTIIRTIDIGADKDVSYLNPHNIDLNIIEPHNTESHKIDSYNKKTNNNNTNKTNHFREPNPALGLRGIRLCLAQPDIFKTQLRALFRAACYGNLSVMYPMITSENEIDRIKGIVSEVETELSKEGVKYRLPRQGIMIETPAAAMISDILASKTEFFSIGTNDLIQYTLACDRQNEMIAGYRDKYHPAVMRLIEMTVSNAHRAGIPVGICGELAGDEDFTERFIAMGVDELSVSPHIILPLREIIQSCP